MQAVHTWYLYTRAALKIQCARYCRECDDSDVDGKHHYTLDISQSGRFILCELTITPNAFELRRTQLMRTRTVKENRMVRMDRKQ